MLDIIINTKNHVQNILHVYNQIPTLVLKTIFTLILHNVESSSDSRTQNVLLHFMHNNVESNTDSSSHKCGDFHFINSLTQNWSIIVSHDTSPNHCPQPHPTRTFLDSLNESSNTHWLTRLTVSIYYYYPSRDARVAGHITILKIIIKKRIKLSPFKNPLWNPKSYSTWFSLKYHA